eukprot:13549768-Heterocapsa_arctica.AAC.1
MMSRMAGRSGQRALQVPHCPGSLGGRPMVSLGQRPVSNAVEPTRRSRRPEGVPGLPDIRRFVSGFRGHVMVEHGWVRACRACDYAANR